MSKKWKCVLNQIEGSSMIVHLLDTGESGM